MFFDPQFGHRNAHRGDKQIDGGVHHGLAHKFRIALAAGVGAPVDPHSITSVWRPRWVGI